MADSTYGVTSKGFVTPQIADIQLALNQQFQARLGNVNTSDSSVLGQLSGIFAEREMLIWHMAAALYAANTVSGATGDALDNMLALQGLSRKAAIASRTAQSPVTQADGRTLYGFVLYGTPGVIVPAGALFATSATSTVRFALDNQVTIGAASNARQVVTFYATATAGQYTLNLSDASGNTYSIANIAQTDPISATVLTLNADAASSDTFTLTLDGQTTQPIVANATSAQVQTAINALSPYSTASVTTSPDGTLAVKFPGGATPTMAATGSKAPSVANSLQARVSALSTGSVRPFTDVAVTQTSSGYMLDFGALGVASGQPSSAAIAIPLASITNSTLVSNNAVVNLGVSQPRVGAPAQAIASATATQTGAYEASANTLTTIVTPQPGLTGSTNQLDVIAGQDVESDASAVARLLAQRDGLGVNSLSSATSAIRRLDGVTAALGYTNETSAAFQRLKWQGAPTSGTFILTCDAGTTAAIAYNATAAQVQAALAKLTDMSAVQVYGDLQNGMIVNFNGARGGQPQNKMSVRSNTTGSNLSVSFDRPPHSVEMVVAGGDTEAIAEQMLNYLPDGIALYGSPAEQTLGSVMAGSSQLTVNDATSVEVGQIVIMPGLARGTQVASISDNNLTLTAAALTTQSGVDCLFVNGALLSDASGTPLLVQFTRPEQTLITVIVHLVTDQYNTPGDASSGINANAQWSPDKAAAIQADLVSIGNSYGIGALIVARGTNGLMSAFREVTGVVDFTLQFGIGDAPTNTNNIQMTSKQQPLFQTSKVQITYE